VGKSLALAFGQIPLKQSGSSPCGTLRSFEDPCSWQSHFPALIILSSFDINGVHQFILSLTFFIRNWKISNRKLKITNHKLTLNTRNAGIMER
jgi:hypothetical protein